MRLACKKVGIYLFVMVISKNVLAFKNLGHRVGAGKKGVYKDLPENSLIALDRVLNGEKGNEDRALQYHEEFHYLEFDLQETRDHHLVLFHDKSLRRMLPYHINKDAYQEILKDPYIQQELPGRAYHYKRLEIKHLTLDQLKTLHFKDGHGHVPTFMEFLQKALKSNLRKPLAVDVKYLHSYRGKMKFIEQLNWFKDKFYAKSIIFSSEYDMSGSGVSILGLPDNFKNTFGKNEEEKKYWCEVLNDKGHPIIYRAKKHEVNLCDLD